MREIYCEAIEEIFRGAELLLAHLALGLVAYGLIEARGWG
jgi:hypothetical protein